MRVKLANQAVVGTTVPASSTTSAGNASGGDAGQSRDALSLSGAHRRPQTAYEKGFQQEVAARRDHHLGSVATGVGLGTFLGGTILGSLICGNVLALGFAWLCAPLMVLGVAGLTLGLTRLDRSHNEAANGKFLESLPD